MVMKKIPKHSSSRNLLPYFIESKIWKYHKQIVTDNYNHWSKIDPIRASRMWAARKHNRDGYTVAEYLYDMIECVYSSKLARPTMDRLYNEIDDVEKWHQDKGTLNTEM